MEHLKIFIELTRLNKPIGFMLLFWPCSWGLALAYIQDQNSTIFLVHIILFFLGAILMRSAGCIFNDIVDKDFDKKVERTKNRPITSKKISVKKSFLYIVVLCLLAFIVLIQFNFKTILLGLSSMLLAFSYPFLKRFTYWPQLFLGLTFNWGMIMGYVSILDTISVDIIVLYISAIFWTLGYDTIYGAQDIVDDEIIGIKSTAIKFKKQIKLFVSTCYMITSVLIFYIFIEKLRLNFFTLFLIMFFISLIYQLIIFKKENASSCLRAFRMNNLSGFFLLASIMFLKL
tara:strand:- start:317 stop:1177 length:861 start_codon:yes stop_codon:yes gene_type:complete